VEATTLTTATHTSERASEWMDRRGVLVANRGEVACRVIRAARAMGLRAVAVHTVSDRGALHTRLADESLLVPAYTDPAALATAAARARCTLLHPGYGFLAESPALAEASAAAGIVFVGPPPAALRLLADKRAARTAAAKAGVPVLPAVWEDEDEPQKRDADERLAARAAREVGFPCMVKPARGGGGKGMHAVDDHPALLAAIARARREAASAACATPLVVERRVVRARHVEVQVFADGHGTVVHVGDRDCSVQRRHQKLLEIAPAPQLAAETRAELRHAAIAAVRAAGGHTGAATVEFLVEDSRRVWFLEVNARLQVEHAVTELVAGVDLVRWQLAVALGDPLPLAQHDIDARLEAGGCAIEARLCAEHPLSRFAPSVGVVSRFKLAAAEALPCVRVDTGVTEGDSVDVAYDSLLAKVTAWGSNQQDALRKLDAALARCQVAGVATNIGLLRLLAHDPASPLVQGGPAHTRFLEADPVGRNLVLRSDDPLFASSDDDALVAAALAAWQRPRAIPTQERGWRLAGERTPVPVVWDHASAQNRRNMAVVEWIPPSSTTAPTKGQAMNVTVGSGTEATRVRSWASEKREDGSFELEVGGRYFSAVNVVQGKRKHELCIFLPDRAITVMLPNPDDTGLVTKPQNEGAGSNKVFATTVAAPLTAKVSKIHVKQGDVVKQGQTLATLEAMKMEHTIESPQSGTITNITCATGSLVTQGDILFTIA